MPPSAKFSGSSPGPGLITIDERSWAIFVAYTQKHLTLGEVGRMYDLPAHRVRRIVRQVEHGLSQVGAAEQGPLEVESAIEQLGLPVRPLNALRAIGCKTIGDLLRLDLSAPVRGLGAKSKASLLNRLSLKGFSHPGVEETQPSEIRLLQSSLERIQRRVDWALGSVAKEIAAVKQRLRKSAESRVGERGTPTL
jgi:Bacterial RNA polymerase, alpha chain C terminal domain/Sigma-70, region 4